MRAYTELACSIGFGSLPDVLKISVPRHLPQIAKTIVSLIAIYMVYMLRRPFTGYVRPSKAMRELFAVVNGYGPIPCRLRRARQLAYKIRSLFMRDPCKDACIGVIAK